LASLYLDWGHWEEAEFYEKRALLTMEYNQSHASILSTWLPNFIRFVKSLAPKQSSKRQAPIQGENRSLSLWQAYSLMGQIKMGLQNNKEALSFFQKSLAAEQKDPDRTPSGHIQVLNLMAENYLVLQQPSDAQSCFEEALNTAKTNFKPNSIEIADSMEHLGIFYRSQNNEVKAKPLLASAREICRGCVGTYFGYTSLPYVEKLAKADESLGQYNEALDLLQKYLQSSRESFGTNHPRVAVGLLDLAEVEKAMGQDAVAQNNLKQALIIAQSLYGNDYPLVIKIQKQIHP
jgi:tetratricopeptide (TPR) repeat protein